MTSKAGSEQTRLVFPPGLKAKAAAAAKVDGRSLNNWVIRLIERGVSQMVKLHWYSVSFDWDKTGTVAASLEAEVIGLDDGTWSLQIDTFTAESGGGCGYWISRKNEDRTSDKYIENEPAASFEEAEIKIQAWLKARNIID